MLRVACFPAIVRNLAFNHQDFMKVGSATPEDDTEVAEDDDGL